MEISNYKPIKFLPVFSKVFEKIIYNGIINLISKNKIPNLNQFGFGKGLSTINAISKFMPALLHKLDNYIKAIETALKSLKAILVTNLCP